MTIAEDVAVKTATDPVCGMTVDPATTAHHADHAGETFHFCSAGCRARFIADPDRYLSGQPQPEPEATPGATWTCPMHPEIRQEGPGTCPICGMALEPAEPSLDDAPNPELVDFTRRFWVSAALAIPLLVIAMGAEMLGLRLVSPPSRPGSSSRSPRRSCCGPAGLSSSAAGPRSRRGISTCSR